MRQSSFLKRRNNVSRICCRPGTFDFEKASVTEGGRRRDSCFRSFSSTFPSGSKGGGGRLDIPAAPQSSKGGLLPPIPPSPVFLGKSEAKELADGGADGRWWSESLSAVAGGFLGLVSANKGTISTPWEEGPERIKERGRPGSRSGAKKVGLSSLNRVLLRKKWVIKRRWVKYWSFASASFWWRRCWRRR